MDASDLASSLHRQNDSKLVLVVADGLGGTGGEHGTELEAAKTPNLDTLAHEGVTGLLTPVAPGITCGSGPGHFALFGYDPVQHDVGRGVLTALGVNFPLQRGDVAARGNFCTVDESGRVLDRRAGRITSDHAEVLLRELRQIEIEGAELFLEPVKEHRFLLVLRGTDLGAQVDNTDPQQTGVPPEEPHAREKASRRTADLVADFLVQARKLLADREPANMVLLRGFASLPDLPAMSERYGVRACALAGYPMYKGIARLLGMDAPDCGPDLESQLAAVDDIWQEYDYVFLHYKASDSKGEDGDFDAKVRALEELDRCIPQLKKLSPDVLVVTGDHSTPSHLGGHSWHPVPVVLHASTCRRDTVRVFGESACLGGGLGHMLSKDLMPVMLAHAGRLRKYGA